MAAIPPTLDSLGSAVAHMRMLELARAAALRSPELQGSVLEQRNREHLEGERARGDSDLLNEARRVGLGERTQMPASNQEQGPSGEVPLLQARARTAVAGFMETVEELRRRQPGQQ